MIGAAEFLLWMVVFGFITGMALGGVSAFGVAAVVVILAGMALALVLNAYAREAPSG